MPYASSMFGASPDLTKSCAGSRGLTHWPGYRCNVKGAPLRQSAIVGASTPVGTHRQPHRGLLVSTAADLAGGHGTGFAIPTPASAYRPVYSWAQRPNAESGRPVGCSSEGLDHDVTRSRSQEWPQPASIVLAPLRDA